MGKQSLIKLRDDITWSDGDTLTADDFVFTYEMHWQRETSP